MLQQVQIINGQKVLVPLSGSTPTDIVQSGNMNPVTSNAVDVAFKNLKVLSKSSTTIASNFSLTSSGKTYTMTKKGLLKVAFAELGSGYTLYLERNGNTVDRVAFYVGNTNGYNTEDLECFVDIGDVINIYSNGDYSNFKIQNILLQELEFSY